MLELTVHRQNGNLLDHTDPDTVIFYDEVVEIRCISQRTCEMHLYVTVAGKLPGRGQEHNVTIYDGALPRGTEWTEKVHIKHPRSPLQGPHLEVSITAQYDNVEALKGTVTDEERLLLPFETLPASNPSFLVPFSASASAKSSGEALEKPTLPELITEQQREIALIAAAAPKEEANKIEVFRWRAPLKQAIELEMRSMRPALDRMRVLAEVNILAVADGVRVKKCSVDMDDGAVELMGPSELPCELDEGGIFAQCYNLQLRASQQSTSAPIPAKTLSILIECELNFPAFSSSITTTWSPIVDFEGIQGPLPRTPAIHINSHSPLFNPNSSSVSLAADAASASEHRHNSSSTLDLLSGSGRRASANLSLMSGLSIFISGPQFVKVGETFQWSFKAMSRSQRERAFAISFGESSQSVTRNGAQLTSQDLLQSFSKYDSDLLRSRMKAHYSAIESNNGIIPLCSGFTVGKLAPQGCFETTVDLKALSVGTHTIESSRIRDLATGDTYDVGALLEVIVIE